MRRSLVCAALAVALGVTLISSERAAAADVAIQPAVLSAPAHGSLSLAAADNAGNSGVATIQNVGHRRRVVARRYDVYRPYYGYRVYKPYRTSYYRPYYYGARYSPYFYGGYGYYGPRWGAYYGPRAYGGYGGPRSW